MFETAFIIAALVVGFILGVIWGSKHKAGQATVAADAQKVVDKVQGGFTMIELMIVVAIVGILAAIAIPQYQDYTTRAYVSEGLQLAAAAKTAVSEAVQSQGAYPVTNAQAGYGGATTLLVSSITVGAGGVITITYSADPRLGGAASKTVDLTPPLIASIQAGSPVTWTCSTSTSAAPMPFKYLPANCRF